MVTPAEADLASVCDKLARSHPGGEALLQRAYAAVVAVDAEAAAGGVEACDLLADLRMDPAAHAAAMVAQLAIEGLLGPEVIREQLGEDAAGLVDGVLRVAAFRWDRIDGEVAESLRKMFMAMAADMRVVIVALALRLRDMRALRRRPDVDRRSIARETLEIYAPLANRLGIFQLKWELEDLALRELEPEIYREIGAALAARREERTGLITEAIRVLEEKLAQAGIEGKISGRPKHIYSI